MYLYTKDSVYLYQSALYCETCGENICKDLRAQGKAPESSDENTHDSDDFPKGPYSDGGGEADSPQHCDACGEFLRNPLTPDGLDYVKERIEQYMHGGKGNVAVLKEWAEEYDLEWPEVGGLYFARFDICAAYYAYMTNWHGGQWSKEYALTGTFSRLKFDPGAGFTQDPWEMEENVRGIYWSLVSGSTKLRDRRS